MPEPLPLKVELISAPAHPLGTLYYVWKQSRHNAPLPSPQDIEEVLNAVPYLAAGNNFCGSPQDKRLEETCNLLMFSNSNYPSLKEQVIECARHIRDELQMILHESIPVVENINFVFHLQNIPISLREQLVRHRIGVQIDPRVGADIAPLGLMEMRQIPDLAESTWWSQTSRVIPYDEFYDAGRFMVPPGLKGKRVKDDEYALFLLGMAAANDEHPENLAKVDKWIADADANFEDNTFDAEAYYKQCLERIQHRYRRMMESGIHIEDCRNLIPTGATHNITWGVNLKALLHIFGKRSSWIAQVNLWGEVMGQMADELTKKVHPMFRMVLLPQCIKKGKYVGCPVDGTNAERVAGVDGMPPCPIWVRYETDKALEAEKGSYQGHFPGVDKPAWLSPKSPSGGESALSDSSTNPEDIVNWSAMDHVQKAMLNENAAQFSKLWGFDVFEPIPEEILHAE